MANDDPHDLVGRRLNGRFRVDRVAHAGARGVVYEAWDEERAVQVAVKVAAPQADAELAREVAERFEAEGRLHARLADETTGLAKVVATGTEQVEENGAALAWRALAWLDGQTLADALWVRRLRDAHGQPIEAVLTLLDPVLDAVARAHRDGVAHLGLGPRAILLAAGASGPHAVLMNLGAAGVAAAHARHQVPEVASLARMAPEQIELRLGEAGPRADVYALALVVVELLADTAPIAGEHPTEVIEAVLDPERRPTPRALAIAVGDAVERVLADALSVEPEARPANAAAFRDALRLAAREDVGRVSTVPRADSSARRPAVAPPLESLGLLKVPYGEVSIRTISALPPPPRLPVVPGFAADGRRSARRALRAAIGVTVVVVLALAFAALGFWLGS